MSDVRAKATAVSVCTVGMRRWKQCVEIPRWSARTHVACIFCSDALLKGPVTGLPKKMKLGTNKIRGANYRLMLTGWSGVGFHLTPTAPISDYIYIYTYI